MSAITIPDILAMKRKNKIVMITAYSASMARLMDDHADIILVGDSLGMTLHGLANTLGVTLDMMISAGQAVCRGRKKALVVVDMPFSTYEKSPQMAYENAALLLQKTGADAVKLEGGYLMQETVEFLTCRHIPVMGHVGLLPQNVHAYGGYPVQGKNLHEQNLLLQDIKSIENAGAFAIVIEGTRADAAEKMTRSVSVPTIGIGASLLCDGQVLVSDDLLGITDKTAKFVKKYAHLRQDIGQAFASFAADVREGKFPTDTYLYHAPQETE